MNFRTICFRFCFLRDGANDLRFVRFFLFIINSKDGYLSLNSVKSVKIQALGSTISKKKLILHLYIKELCFKRINLALISVKRNHDCRSSLSGRRKFIFTIYYHYRHTQNYWKAAYQSIDEEKAVLFFLRATKNWFWVTTWWINEITWNESIVELDISQKKYYHNLFTRNSG